MKVTAEEALVIGGEEWTSRDGKVHRLYLSICDLMGVKVERYRSGNVSYAARNGVKISNTEAMRVMSVKVFVADGELVITGAESVRSFTVADIEAAVVARLALVQFDAATTDQAAATLVAEGYEEADVLAAIDKLITDELGGYPAERYLLSSTIVDILRKRLSGTDA